MKRSKTKLIIPSLLTILGSIALSAGSTYSLFTSESQNNITISSGKVEVTSSLTIESLYSPEKIDSEGNMSGDNKANKNSDNLSGSFFSGTISIDNTGKVELKNMLPGDKAILKLDITNKSSISSKYMVKLESSYGLALYDLLNVGVYDDNNLVKKSTDFVEGVTSIKSSEWTTLSAANEGNNSITKYLLIELPSTLTYGSGLSTALSLKVEAVQNNGTTSSLYTLPNGVTPASFDSIEIKDVYTGFGDGIAKQEGIMTSHPTRNNKATAYYNGKYFDGLGSALRSVALTSDDDNPIVYLKPNSTTYEDNFGYINKSVTIYGNNANIMWDDTNNTKGHTNVYGRLNLSYGEDKSGNPSKVDLLTSDTTINAYDVNNLTLFGYHSSQYSLTMNAYRCKINTFYVNTNNSVGDLNYNIIDSILDGSSYNGTLAALYNNDNGTISVKNSVFKNIFKS